MKPRMITVLALVAILAVTFLGVPGSLAAPPAPAYRSVAVVEGAPPKAVLLGDKDILEFKAPINPSTGYRWQVEQAGNLKLLEVVYSEAQQPGDAVTAILRFAPTSAGKAALKLAYVPPQKNAPAVKYYETAVQSKSAFKGVFVPAPVVKAPETQTTAPGLAAGYNYCTNIGGCTPIKNQGSCGSCWAFATIGVAEQVVKGAGGGTLDMSEQYLVNCSPWNCSGGWDAFAYLISTAGKSGNQPGWRTEAQVPYRGANGTCTLTTPSGKLTSTGSGGSGTTGLKAGIQNYGPLWVTVCAGSRMSAYTGGIFSTNECGTVNHAVIIYGWEDTGSYWYMRNSWGSGWGEAGTMRITYGTSQIGGGARFGTYSGGPNPTPTRTPTGVVPTPTRTPTGVQPTPTRTPTGVVPPTPTPDGETTWQAWTWYNVGATVIYNGVNYRCQIAHTSQPDWTPDVVPALWVRL